MKDKIEQKVAEEQKNEKDHEQGEKKGADGKLLLGQHSQETGYDQKSFIREKSKVWVIFGDNCDGIPGKNTGSMGENGS